ncbi:MAG: ornithine carbamoyltransferase [Planctomycetes bacterium]|nr:ornithine carbamoyltransferase [Planctomycetota bacterium]
MENFVNLNTWSSEAIESIIQLSLKLKKECKNNIPHELLKGKNVGMVFDKSSLRTRVSFEVGINQLGAHAIVLGSSAGKLGEREPVSDFARVSSRYVDGLVVRTYEEARVEELAQHATVPIINALTDESHPCQALGDMQTLLEHWGQLKDNILVYVGDSNNVVRSLMKASCRLGLKMRIASPEGYQFDREEIAWGEEQGFSFHTDPKEAVEGAHAIYTDVWTSMGQEEEKERRLKAFQGYEVNDDLLSYAHDEVKVLHCLPAHRGEEISHEVIEGPHSIVFDQAENRLHIQKAIMATLFK